MRSFLPSLALVLLAQIPLLLKLWLDYKSKTSGIKQELFNRQLDAFQSLTQELTSLHENLGHVVQVFPDSSLFDEKSLQELATSAYTAALKSNVAFHERNRSVDLLLPAELSIACHKYTQGASRIIECAWNLPTFRQSARPDIAKLWIDQETQFNLTLNMMRVTIGIDPLSSSIVRDVHAGRKMTVIMRENNQSSS